MAAIFRYPFPKRNVHRFEVLSVYINNTKDDESTLSPADIIGDIFLIADSVPESVNGVELFARKKGDYDSFQPGIDTELLLTGPSTAHKIDNCCGYNYICFALFELPPEDAEEDQEDMYMPYSAIDMYKSEGAMEEASDEWMLVRSYDEKPDKIQSKTVFGEYGSVTIDYIVYSIPTVQAMVEVMIILKDAASAAQHDVVVDGRITAHNTLYEKKEILLFRSHKGKHVKHGQLIPLSKSCLVLPFESSLVIGTYLSIANRYVKFCVPKYPGTSKRLVYGKRCKMLIQVTWSNYSTRLRNRPA